MSSKRSPVTVACLCVAAAVAVAAVVDSVRHHSLGPIMTVAWLPAVAAAFWPARKGRCS